MLNENFLQKIRNISTENGNSHLAGEKVHFQQPYDHILFAPENCGADVHFEPWHPARSPAPPGT